MHTYIVQFSYDHGNGYAIVNGKSPQNIEGTLRRQSKYEHITVTSYREIEYFGNDTSLIFEGGITTYGHSAYDIAVEHGYRGTEEQWLESLKSQGGAEEAVLYIEQSLNDSQKQQARANIGAGTSSFSGDYAELSNKPDLFQNRGSINILFIGNSNMIDSIAYLPTVMNSINPNIELKVGMAYIAGSCIAQHLAYFSNVDEAHKIEITISPTSFSGNYAAGTFGYWVDENNTTYPYIKKIGDEEPRGIKGYDYRMCVSGGAWSNPEELLASQVLNAERWDLIVLQDAANNIEWSNLAKYLLPLHKTIGSSVNHTIQFGWLMSHTAANSSDLMRTQWRDLVNIAIGVMQQTGTSILFAPGTCIQNLRTIPSIAELGGDENTYHNLCADNIHLQEGIGCLGAAYTIACEILRAMGLSFEGVIGEPTRPDMAWLRAKKIPSLNPTPDPNSATNIVVGIDNTNCLIAQIAAINATKYPYRVIRPLLSVSTANRIVDRVDEFVPSPNSEGTAGQVLSLNENGNTIWTSGLPSKIPIRTASGETLSAVADTYYHFTDNVGTLAITLPVPTDRTHTASIIFTFTTGSSPAITFTTAQINGAILPIYIQDGFTFEASTTYEVKAIFNGTAWVVSALKVSLTT